MSEREIPTVNERPDGMFPSTRVTNEIARAVQAMAPAMPHGNVGGPGHSAVLDLWLVWDVGPNGEDDFEDHRYWLRRVYVANAAATPPADNSQDAAELQEIPISDDDAPTSPDWIFATNVAERPVASGPPPSPPSSPPPPGSPPAAPWPYPSGHALTKGRVVGPIWAQFDDAAPYAQRFIFNQPELVALVTVTGSSSRPGVYVGYRRREVQRKFDPSGTDQLGANSLNEFGEVPDDDEEIYILNASEEGTDTHALMEGGADTSVTHLGYYRGVATDGSPVYVINGTTAGPCDTP